MPLYEEPKRIINNSWNALYTTFYLRQSYPQPDYLLIIWLRLNSGSEHDFTKTLKVVVTDTEVCSY